VSDESAKGAARTANWVRNSPASHSVLREFLRSAQAAERGPKGADGHPPSGTAKDNAAATGDHFDDVH